MRPPSDIERRRVIDGIEQAFGNVRRGEGTTLHETEVLDDYGSDQELAAARALDIDTRWQDVADELIAEHSGALCFVDPAGFRYYIPAYMRWTVKYFDAGTGSESALHTVLMLTPNRRFQEDGAKLERFRVFSRDESRVICEFLRLMAEHAGFSTQELATNALEDYWGRFCQDPSE